MLNSVKMSGYTLFTLCMVTMFLTSGIFINLMQFITFLLLRPWNKSLYRLVIANLSCFLYAQILFVSEWWGNLDLILYINKDDADRFFGKESSLSILNHTYEIDWIIILVLTDRFKMLGTTKAFAKKSLQYVPGLGIAWKFSEFVMLERSFEKDKEQIVKQVKELTTLEYPLCLMLLPEGTRFTQDKLKASQEFAKERNLPPLKYFLHPRTKGFTITLSAMDGKIPAIYDFLLAFNENEDAPTILNVLKRKKLTAHLYGKRIPIETVPKTVPEQEQFLRNLYVEKDKMKESFVQTGDFFATSGVPREEAFRINRRLYVPLITGISVLTTLVPIVYYFLKFILSGQLYYIGVIIGIISLLVVVFYVILVVAQTTKSSSYGTTTKPVKKLS